MEQLGGGAATSLRRQHRKRRPPSAERFLGILQPQSTSTTTPIELSEEDIFSTPSGSSSPSPTNRYLNPKPSPTRNINRNHYGILAALNGNIKSRSGSGPESRPVFNHKASVSTSISSSSSTSPAASMSSRIMIPRPPPPQPDMVRDIRYQSAPVNIPVMPVALRNRARELEDLASEEEEEEDNNGVILPPHEVAASRQSPRLACSVLEGAGRTLKGRDLRQVRNAIWRKTGFLD
ncbi:hypothetical protein ACS0TY_020161 [Phlomoides rotata]